MLSQPQEVFEIRPQLFGKYFKFENGLQWVLIPDQNFKTFNCQIWYKVGSSYELRGKTGLAHFFEHLMFRGTQKVKAGEFDRLIESHGCPGSNAFTSHDYTGYTTDFPAGKESVILELEADRMKNLNLMDKMIDDERGVILNEMSQTKENQIEGLMWFRLHEMCFEKQPYAWGVIGYREDVSQMKKADFIDFYTSFYNPSNALIVLSGNINEEQVGIAMQKHFESLSNSPIALPYLQKTEIDDLSLTVKKERIDSKLTRTIKKIFAFKVVDENHVDKKALHFLGQVLAAGKSSILYQTFINQALAQDVEYWVWHSRMPGLFCFYFDLEPDFSESDLDQLFFETLDQFFEQLNEDDLLRHRNLYLTSYYQSLKHNDHRSESVGHSFVFGQKWYQGFQEVASLEKIRVQDLKNLRHYFQKNRAFELVAYPLDQK